MAAVIYHMCFAYCTLFLGMTVNEELGFSNDGQVSEANISLVFLQNNDRCFLILDCEDIALSC